MPPNTQSLTDTITDILPLFKETAEPPFKKVGIYFYFFQMIYVFATSRAEDPNQHIQVFETVKPFMEEFGIKAIAAYRSLEDEKEQHILFEAPDAEVFTEFLMAPLSAEKMRESTLIARPDIQYMLKIW